MLKQFDTLLAFSVVMLLLSLIVTALVQAVSAVLDLRGRNLAVAVASLVRQALPGLETHAESIAKALCRHSTVAVGWHATAKVLRSDDIVHLLEHLASDDDRTLDAPAKAALKAALARRLPASTSQHLTVIDAAAKEVARLFPEQAATAEQAASRALTEALGLTRGMAQDIQRWFDPIMDRSSDQFAAQARRVTVVLAWLLAFGLHIDALALLQQLTSDDAMRDALVGRAAAALATAEDLSNSLAVARSVDALMPDLKDDPQTAARFQSVKALGSCREAVARLQADTPVSAALLEKFQTGCWDATITYLSDTRTRFDDVTSGLGLNGLRLYVPFGKDGRYWLYTISGRTLVGTLMTMLFLSLGAPFWFNALRQLSNLRPALAAKVEKQTSGTN